MSADTEVAATSRSVGDLIIFIMRIISGRASEDGGLVRSH
jgi:hypothetical protein